MRGRLETLVKQTANLIHECANVFDLYQRKKVIGEAARIELLSMLLTVVPSQVFFEQSLGTQVLGSGTTLRGSSERLFVRAFYPDQPPHGNYER